MFEAHEIRAMLEKARQPLEAMILLGINCGFDNHDIVTSWNGVKSDRPISKEIAKLLKQLGIHRPGVGFYALRHTFETIGGESCDQVTVDAIMGHVPRDMGGIYRHRISDERLQRVVQIVHDWLFESEG